MIRDRSLLALLAGELVSRLGSQFTTLVASGAALATGPPLRLLVPHSPLWLVGVRLAVVGPLGYALAGVLFASIGLHATYALIAALGTLATLNFVAAAAPYRGEPVAQAAA